MRISILVFLWYKIISVYSDMNVASELLCMCVGLNITLTMFLTTIVILYRMMYRHIRHLALLYNNYECLCLEREFTPFYVHIYSCLIRLKNHSLYTVPY